MKNKDMRMGVFALIFIILALGIAGRADMDAARDRARAEDEIREHLEYTTGRVVVEEEIR